MGKSIAVGPVRRGLMGQVGGIVALAAVVLLAGCVGVTSRSDFSDEIRARGGGFDGAAVRAAVDRVAADMGPDFGLVSLDVNPQSAGVTITARRDNGDVDRYTFSAGDLRAVDPVRVSPGEHPEGSVPSIDLFALDALDDVVAEALDTANVTDGYVDSVHLRRVDDSSLPNGRADLITIEVDGPRSAAVVRFTADGEFLDREDR